MVFLNVHAWYQYPHLSFWDTPWNVCNSFFNILGIIYLVIFPIYAFIVIRMNRNDLDSEENKDRLGVFYEEQRYNTFHGATFNIREMARRFLMVLAILIFNK